MTTTAQTEWCYVRDKDGTLWITETTPDNVIRDSRGGWTFVESGPVWVEIDQETHKPKVMNDFYHRSAGFLSKFIDLSDVPEPEYKDDPIMITMRIKNSIGYYIT